MYLKIYKKNNFILTLMENKNNHEANKKKIEYYINRLQSLNENGDEIKMEIEDPLENQEKEYESKNAKKK